MMTVAHCTRCHVTVQTAGPQESDRWLRDHVCPEQPQPIACLMCLQMAASGN